MAHGFDPERDEVVAELGTVETRTERIIVDIRRYAGGPPKVQISRQSFTDSGWRFDKRQFGRCTIRQAMDLGRLLVGIDHGLGARERSTQVPNSAGHVSPRGDTSPPPTDDDYAGEPEPIDPLVFEPPAFGVRPS